MPFTAHARRLDGGLKHEVDVNGRHVIYTDEPTDIGGSDEGAAPHELLPAALASCISTMVSLYAQRKGWEIGEISVDCSYDYESTPRRFEVDVHLPDGLDQEQIKRLTHVAHTCPVRKAMEAGFEFEERILIGS